MLERREYAAGLVLGLSGLVLGIMLMGKKPVLMATPADDQVEQTSAESKRRAKHHKAKKDKAKKGKREEGKKHYDKEQVSAPVAKEQKKHGRFYRWWHSNDKAKPVEAKAKEKGRKHYGAKKAKKEVALKDVKGEKKEYKKRHHNRHKSEQTKNA